MLLMSTFPRESAVTQCDITKSQIKLHNLTLSRRNNISVVVDNTFCIFNENSTLSLYGESLNLWLSIGGLIRGNVEIHFERGASFYRGTISPSVFFGFIYGREDIFQVTKYEFGYKVKITCDGAVARFTLTVQI